MNHELDSMHGASDKSREDFSQDSRLQTIAGIILPLGNYFFYGDEEMLCIITMILLMMQ
jgi:hypothetical protein